MMDVMRSNLEIFCSFISLDAMKRTTNVQMWPYIGPTVMNELGKTTVVCESLMLEERHEAYVFVLNSMFEMAPMVDRSDVKVLFGDEFLSNSILEETNLSHARLFYDHHHLILIYEKQVGSLFRSIRVVVQKMMNATSEDEYNALKDTLIQSTAGQPRLISFLNDFVNSKQSYVAYEIDSIHGSCLQRGSTRSEQNHSSVIAYIGKEYTGELDHLLKMLLGRQMNLSTEANCLISKEYGQLRVQKNLLLNKNVNHILTEAVSYLCFSAFKSFQMAYQDMHKYTMSSSNGIINVHRDGTTALPRIFMSKESRCDCAKLRSMQF